MHKHVKGLTSRSTLEAGRGGKGWQPPKASIRGGPVPGLRQPESVTIVWRSGEGEPWVEVHGREFSGRVRPTMTVWELLLEVKGWTLGYHH